MRILKLLFVLLSITAGLAREAEAQFTPFGPVFGPERTYFYTTATAANDSIYSFRVKPGQAAGLTSYEMEPYARRVPTNYVCASGEFTHRLYEGSMFGLSWGYSATGYEFDLGYEILNLPLSYPDNVPFTFVQNPLVTGMIVSRQQEQVADTSDFVITYQLSNGRQIKISAHFGFVQVHSFLSYFMQGGPSLAPDLFLNSVPELSVGTIDSGPLQIYDFQPGDMFGYRSVETGNPMPCQFSYYIDKVISRTDNAVTGVRTYQIERSKIDSVSAAVQLNPYTCQAAFASPPSPPAVYTLIVADSLFPGLNLPAFGYRGAYTLVNDYIMPTTFGSRLEYSITSKYDGYCSATERFGGYSPLGHNYTARYVQGLGPVFSYSDADGPQDLLNLLFYRKGTEIYGDSTPFLPLLVNAAPTAPATQPWSVAPNPFINEFTLTATELTTAGCTIALFDITGRQVHQQQLPAAIAEQQVHVQTPAGLKAGLYLLRITSQDGKSFTIRLQKQ